MARKLLKTAVNSKYLKALFVIIAYHVAVGFIILRLSGSSRPQRRAIGLQQLVANSQNATNFESPATIDRRNFLPTARRLSSAVTSSTSTGLDGTTSDTPPTTSRLPLKLLSTEADNSTYRLLISGQLDGYDPRVLRHIRDQLTLPAAAGSTRPNITNIGTDDYSQVGQSLYVDELLRSRRDGFFVECGAADGEYISNTLFFELRRNWTGLLVEANPDYYRHLPGKGRRAYGLQACLGVARRPSVMTLRAAGESGGLLADINQFQMKVQEVVDGRNLDVVCYPLNSIMQALGVSHIDYLSLDVEGSELGVLQTIDWSRLQIDVITVEVHIGGLPNDELGRAEKRNKYEALLSYLLSTRLYRKATFLPPGVNHVHEAHDVVFARLDLAV